MNLCYQSIIISIPSLSVRLCFVTEAALKKFTGAQMKISNRFEKALEKNEWAGHLTERESKNISVAAAIYDKDMKELSEMTFDALHSLQRMGVGKDRSSAMLPNSKIWLMKRGRPMLGIEAMLLQGADPSKFPHAHCNNSLLWELAGNAFCAPCAVKMILAALVTFKI